MCHQDMDEEWEKKVQKRNEVSEDWWKGVDKHQHGKSNNNNKEQECEMLLGAVRGLVGRDRSKTNES